MSGKRKPKPERRVALLRELHRIRDEEDTEGGHVAADKAILDYINDDEITAAFRLIPKWYA